MIRPAAAALACLAVASACAAHQNASSQAQPQQPLQQRHSSAAPASPVPPPVRAGARPSPARATAAPARTATPVPAGSPAPRASATARSTPVPLAAPDAPPRILAVDIAPTTVHSGDVVSGTVTATSNVASVEVRVADYGMSLPKTGVGRFALRYAVPDLPFFVKGRSYPMLIIARNTRGDATTASVQLTVR